MAEDERVSNSYSENGHVPNDNEMQRQGDYNLRNFVSEEFHNQRLNGPPDGNQISDERAVQFLQRALGESQRMANETTRSQRQQQRLYAELGEERFQEWTKEHLEEAVKNAVRKAEEDAMHVER